MGKGFDEYAPAYDAWFLENRNVLYSEINLVAHVLKKSGADALGRLRQRTLRNDSGQRVRYHDHRRHRTVGRNGRNRPQAGG